MVDDFSTAGRGADGDRRTTPSRTRGSRLIERDVNGHIVAASNDGVDAARGEFVALLDHDDLLVPRGAGTRRRGHRPPRRRRLPLHRRGQGRPRTGDHYGAFAKPDWSPERLRGQMYTCHLSVLRTSAGRRGRRLPRGLRGLPGPRPRAARDRAGAPGRRTSPRCSTTGAPSRARPRSTSRPSRTPETAGDPRRAGALDRVGIDAEAELRAPSRAATAYAVELAPERTRQRRHPHRRPDRPGPRASARLLVRRGGALTPRAQPTTSDVEVVVVHDTPTPPAVLDELGRSPGSGSCWCRSTRPFNFSEKVNVGVLPRHRRPCWCCSTTTSRRSPRAGSSSSSPSLAARRGLIGAKLLLRRPDRPARRPRLLRQRRHHHPLQVLDPRRGRPLRRARRSTARSPA